MDGIKVHLWQSLGVHHGISCIISTNKVLDLGHKWEDGYCPFLVGNGKLKKFSCLAMQTIYEHVVENSMAIKTFINIFL